MAEIRFNTDSSAWEIWENGAFTAPAATNLGGADQVVFNADANNGGVFDALADSDTYIIETGYTANLVLNDPQVGDGTLNRVYFDIGVYGTSVALLDGAFGSQSLVITLSTGNTVTIETLGSFEFFILGITPNALTAAAFAEQFETGWADPPASNALFIDKDLPIVLTTDNDPNNVFTIFNTPILAGDTNGDAITYSVLDAPFAGLSIGPDGRLIYSNGDPAPAGIHTLVIGASSIGVTGAAVIVTRTIELHVTDVQRFVEIDPATPAALDFREGIDGRATTVLLTTVNATDPNGDEVTFAISSDAMNAGFVIDPTSGRLTYEGDGSEIGITQIAVSVSSEGPDGPTTVTHVIALNVIAGPPVIVGTDASETLGHGDATVPQTIDGGDGSDTINAGQSDDVITGGLGDDTILLWLGDETVNYQASEDGAATDGGDNVNGFIVDPDSTLPGGDLLNLQVDSSMVILPDYDFVSYANGADGIAFTHDDRVHIKINTQESVTESGYQVNGFSLTFREAGVFNAGQTLSSGSLTISFASVSDANGFSDIVGIDQINTDTLTLSATAFETYMGNSFQFSPQRAVTDVSQETVNAAFAAGENLATWDTTGATVDGNGLFYERTTFNDDISDWDVSSVTNLDNAFRNTKAFNQDLSGWDVSNVTTMVGALRGTDSLDHSTLENWRVGNVVTMETVFYQATTMNMDFSNWDVSSATSFRYMFREASAFEGAGLEHWDTSRSVSFSNMFEDATAFNGDVSDWDTSNALRFIHTFKGAVSFNGDISNWDTGRSDDMRGMFTGATIFNQDISGWDVGRIEWFSDMFSGAAAFDQNLGDWDLSAATTLENMFTNSGMSLNNMDLTLRGFARVETDESLPIEMAFGFLDVDYSDLTALNRLETDFGWSVAKGNLVSPDGYALYASATNGDDTVSFVENTEGVVAHMLDGNDTVTGSGFADHLHGGAGNDTLEGGAGADVFHIHFSNSGHDTITDFDIARDSIDISGLLEGFTLGSASFDEYVSFSDDSGDTVITFDLDGLAGNAGSENPTSWDVSVTLQGVTIADLGGSPYEMWADGLLVDVDIV